MGFWVSNDGGVTSLILYLIEQIVVMATTTYLSYKVLITTVNHLIPKHKASKKSAERNEEIATRLGRPLFHTNPHEDVIACSVTNPDDIDIEFNSIGGLESQKQAIFELTILPLKRPELFSHGRKLMEPSKGVLLYGPPGTGKTMLAKAIAKESGAVFINVRKSSVMCKWLGETEKLVAAVFSLAHKLQPAIIFIDEVNGFLGQRHDLDHEAVTSMKTEFMQHWDGFATDRNARVMVLGATNRPSQLDEAILRRFTQAFKIGMPSLEERAEILRVTLRGEMVEGNINFDHLASLSEGCSGSDLFDLCKRAAYVPIRELIADEKNGNPSHAPRPLSQRDLEKVLATPRRTRTAAQEYTRKKNGDDHQVPKAINVPPKLVGDFKIVKFLVILIVLVFIYSLLLLCQFLKI